MAKIEYSIAIMDEESKERNRFINFFEDDFRVIEIPYISSVDKLIEKIKYENIDAVAIDYKLKDHRSKFKENGGYFFKQLITRLKDYPSFVLTNDADKAKRESKLINPRFIISKEILHSDDTKEIARFMADVKHEIKAHKNLIAEKLKKLKKLEKLKKSKKLNENDENEYLILNNDVSELLDYETLPLKYFSQETNKKLDDIILKTDELIKKISKKK